MASHIGVQLGVPTIGVAKNLHLLAEEGEIFEKGDLYKQRLALLSKKVLIGRSWLRNNKDDQDILFSWEFSQYSIPASAGTALMAISLTFLLVFIPLSGRLYYPESGLGNEPVVA